MSQAGLGVSRVPYYLVEKDIADKKLIHLYNNYAITTHPLYLVYPARSYKPRKQKNCP